MPTPPDLPPLAAALAAAPLLVVVGLMLGRGWGSTRAGPAGWLAAVAVAALAFGAGPELLAVSQVRGIVLSLWVLYIVWAALLLYHVTDEAGAMADAGAALARVTGDPLLRFLVLGWAFASLLQGATGFGVPAAVVAPLLVAQGFDPEDAVVAVGVAHGWAVTFGSVGTSMAAMLAVTGLSAAETAPQSAALLGAACLACGIATAWVHGGAASVRHAAPAVLVMGAAMGGVQWLVAGTAAWPLAAIAGGAAGLAVAPVVARLPRYNGGRQAAPRPPGALPLGLALGGYAALVAVVLLVAIVPGLAALLDRFAVSVALPATETARGWANPAGPTRAISVLGHTGALISYAAAIAAAIYAARGRFRSGAAGRIARRTVRAAVAPTLGIAWLVGMAQAMGDSGMTFALAEALERAAGSAYPVAAPAVGALGAFVTGSNANSNVLFASLQRDTAALLGISAAWILAGQNVGGAIGSAFAPAKVVVGASTVGLAGAEGRILRRTMGAGLVIVAASGLATAALVALAGAR